MTVAPEKPDIWVLTDGKAGDEQPLIGIAEAMGGKISIRRVHPRKAFALLMPFGPIDPREAADRAGSPIAPPFPDICLATGRRAVAYLRALKRASPQTTTVFLKDPRTTRHGADLVVVQSHDAGRVENALVVATAPNRMGPSILDELRLSPPRHLAELPSPRIAVLVGGNSRHHRFSGSDIDSFVQGLASIHRDGGSLMITTSRRTPPELADRLARLAQQERVLMWSGEGENPLAAYLALADQVVVTADSTNMVGDGAGAGRPVQVFHPTGGHAKINRFLDALSQQAAIGRFPEDLATESYAPVNSTRQIAEAVLDLWRKNRSD
ncbi:mitochondrial fission ELM1 family protein [Rhizobium halophytocola]|uniref:Mitochondrial fission protein ELM1 n=1 Tax=Rhizobium halophytocola TaxID=735519 RepID=A0ABS4E3W4_9HYPH|nr:mitochondrial fission ELM1 family protein [Rhizobium halophytocola]MBP1852644.1 mitochondrial fission protein ELM1 [Rhizobium halophytocola]